MPSQPRKVLVLTKLFVALDIHGQKSSLFPDVSADPQRAAVALAMIGNLYAVEAKIRERGLKSTQKQDVRLTKARPLVEAFFTKIETALRYDIEIPIKLVSAPMDHVVMAAA